MYNFSIRSLDCSQTNSTVKSVCEPEPQSFFRTPKEVPDYMYSSVIGLWSNDFDGFNGWIFLWCRLPSHKHAVIVWNTLPMEAALKGGEGGELDTGGRGSGGKRLREGRVRRFLAALLKCHWHKKNRAVFLDQLQSTWQPQCAHFSYMLRLDYQPLFGKMSPRSSPEGDEDRTRDSGGNRAYYMPWCPPTRCRDLS